jgi:hypothetical protein
VYTLDNRARRAELYTATVRDGYPDQQAAILDRDWLIELWPDLWIPARCRATWEAAFPELAALRTRVRMP